MLCLKPFLATVKKEKITIIEKKYIPYVHTHKINVLQDFASTKPDSPVKFCGMNTITEFVFNTVIDVTGSISCSKLRLYTQIKRPNREHVFRVNRLIFFVKNIVSWSY